MNNYDSRCSMFFIIFAVAALFVVPSIQLSHASNFIVDAQCVEGHWYVVIYDGDGDGDDNIYDNTNEKNPLENMGIIQGVSIRTIPSVGSSNVKSTFETDDSGSFFLAPEYNTGWVWLSKPGYNDQKIRSSCDTAYDAFSYSKQFASYCYDYTHQFIPMTLLSDMTDTHTVKHMVDFFIAQIASRDDTIKQQTLDMMTLLDVLNDNNNSTIYDIILNSTKDEMCLLHIDDAIGEAYEKLGVLHVQQSNILSTFDMNDMQHIAYDDIDAAKTKLHDVVNTHCANVTLQTAHKMQVGLDVLDVLYEEQRRQVSDLQYMLFMDTLVYSQQSATQHLQPSSHLHLHQQHQQQQQQQQPAQTYYYYNNNYYLDDNNYDSSGNNRHGFYHYDATDTKPYDYTKHENTKNYNPIHHEDHNHSHVNCITFCDQTDYEPDWARYLSIRDAREACWDVDADLQRLGTADWYWCKDLDRYLYDK